MEQPPEEGRWERLQELWKVSAVQRTSVCIHLQLVKCGVDFRPDTSRLTPPRYKVVSSRKACLNKIR